MSDDRKLKTENSELGTVLAVHIEVLTGRVAQLVEQFEADDQALWGALERIAEAPHRSLRPDRPCVSVGEARGLRADLIVRSLLQDGALAIASDQGHVRARGVRWRLLRVVDDRSVLEHDTVPNRFVAHVVRSLRTELRRLGRRLGRLPRDEAAVVQAVEDAADMRRRLGSLLVRSPVLRRASLLDQMPLDNLVLRHDACYRRVMEAWLALR